MLNCYVQEPDGSTDGVDKFPGTAYMRLLPCSRLVLTVSATVYSVTPNNTLFYTMQKLLASE